MADSQFGAFASLLDSHRQEELGKVQAGAKKTPSSLARLWTEFRADQGLDEGEAPSDRQMVDFYTMAARRLPYSASVPNNPRNMFLAAASNHGLHSAGSEFIKLERAPNESWIPDPVAGFGRAAGGGIGEALQHPEYLPRLGRGFVQGGLQRLTGGVLGRAYADPMSGNISQKVEGTGQLWGGMTGEVLKNLGIMAAERAALASGVGTPAVLAERAARAARLAKGGWTSMKDMKRAAALWAALGAGSGYAESKERDTINEQRRKEGETDAPATMTPLQRLFYTGVSAGGDALNVLGYAPVSSALFDIAKAGVIDATTNALVNGSQMAALEGIAGESAEAVKNAGIGGAWMGAGFGLGKAGLDVGKFAMPSRSKVLTDTKGKVMGADTVGGTEIPVEEVADPRKGQRIGQRTRPNEIPVAYDGDMEFVTREVGRPITDDEIPGVPEASTIAWRRQRLAPVVRSTMDERMDATRGQVQGLMRSLETAATNPDKAEGTLRVPKPVPAHQTLTYYLNNGPWGQLTSDGPHVGESFTGYYTRGDESAAIGKALDGSTGSKLTADLMKNRSSIVDSEDPLHQAMEIPADYSALWRSEAIDDPAFPGESLYVTALKEGEYDKDKKQRVGPTTLALWRKGRDGAAGEWASEVPVDWSPGTAEFMAKRQEKADKRAADRAAQPEREPRDPGAPATPWNAKRQWADIKKLLSNGRLMSSHN